MEIAFDRLIEPSRFDSVQGREISIEDDLLAADDEDLLGDTLGNEGRRRFVLLCDASVLHIGRNGPDG